MTNKMNLQLFAAATNTTVAADLEPAISVDFTSRISQNIDELRRDVVYDIKTTSRYQFGKYARGWQRHVYPYCLIASGMMEDVKAFEYTAYQLKKSRTGLISGTRYPEYYVYDHAQSTAMLTAHCEAFIEFLEANRELITDKKIFGNTEE